MSTHLHTRLETTGGTVIAYLAPQFEVHPSDQNDVQSVARPSEEPPRIRGKQLWTSELTVQGAFEHTDNLPQPHASALRTLFGQSNVSARDQINRLRDQVVYGAGGPYHFYHGADEYVNEIASGVDASVGQYPVVEVEELRHPQEAGLDRSSYMVRLTVGVDP